jgi:hypothetical protein
MYQQGSLQHLCILVPLSHRIIFVSLHLGFKILTPDLCGAKSGVFFFPAGKKFILIFLTRSPSHFEALNFVSNLFSLDERSDFQKSIFAKISFKF